MNIRSKIQRSIVPLAVVVSLLVSVGAIWQFSRAMSQQAIRQLESVASIQQQRVQDFLTARGEAVALLTSRTQLRRDLNDYNNTPSVTSLDRVERILADAVLASPNLLGVVLFDKQGSRLVGAGSLKGVDVAPQLLRQIEYEDDGTPRQRLSSPLVMANGDVVGSLIAEFSMLRLAKIIQNYTGLGETGETIVARRTRAGDAEHLIPLRFDPSARRVESGSDAERPINLALRRAETVSSDHRDYRDEPVFAVTRHIPSADWGLVVKIDRGEVYGHAYRLTVYLLISVLLGLGLFMLVTRRIASQIAKPIVELRDAALEIASGNLKRRASRTTHDEIGQLTDAFNKMAGELVSAQNNLTDARIELEEQVACRSRELNALHERMQTDNLDAGNEHDRLYFEVNLERSWNHCLRTHSSIALLLIQADCDSASLSGNSEATLMSCASQFVTRSLDCAAHFDANIVAVLLPDTDLEGARIVADRIREYVEVSNSGKQTVTVGIGAILPDEHKRAEELIDLADSALDDGRNEGGNCISS